MGGGRAQHSVSLPEKNILVLVVKIYTKTDIKVSRPVQFCSFDIVSLISPAIAGLNIDFFITGQIVRQKRYYIDQGEFQTGHQTKL